MLIDCHVHPAGAELEPGLLREVERLGVDRLCVCSLGREWVYEPEPDLCRQANDDVRALMRRYPDLVLGFCYANPAYPEQARAEMRRCVEDLGMVGLKLWVAVPADDPRVFPLVEQAIGYGIPILQHAWHKATGNLPHESFPTQVAALARRYPEARIIMAHMAGDWRRGVAAVRECPNVCVDTSGSIMDLGMVEHGVEALGGERVIFGSDAHGAELGAALGKVLGAEVSEQERRQILGGNMERLLAGRAG